MVSCASAVRRSDGFIPRRLTESSAMLSWRGGVGGSAGTGRFLIMLLLDDVRIVPGASPETAFDQQMMQLNEPRHRHARRADLQDRKSTRLNSSHVKISYAVF